MKHLTSRDHYLATVAWYNDALICWRIGSTNGLVCYAGEALKSARRCGALVGKTDPRWKLNLAELAFRTAGNALELAGSKKAARRCYREAAEYYLASVPNDFTPDRQDLQDEWVKPYLEALP